MYLLESPSLDPRFNLALEQHVFDNLPRDRAWCLLWRNGPSVIVGKFQNTLGEICPARVRELGVQVVRRLSGGGAVYHDAGNVNYTFVTSDSQGKALDFATFGKPLVDALAEIGVVVEQNGRNDLTLNGRKCSGSAQYRKDGRVMHHGTLLYDTDCDIMSQVLTPPPDKLTSKGLPSIRSRVTNIREHLSQDMPVEAFMAHLRAALTRVCGLRPHTLDPADMAAVTALRQARYDTWEWNMGASPACQLQKVRRIEGCGTVEVHLDVEQGRLTRMVLYGDFFSSADPAELAARLVGHPLERNALEAVLARTPVELYVHNLHRAALLELLLE